jgi:hypothetical protein
VVQACMRLLMLGCGNEAGCTDGCAKTAHAALLSPIIHHHKRCIIV